MLFGVVALPVLLPIAGLLQLLFPGLLREQWRQYKYVVRVLIMQSTLIFIHWALLTWVYDKQPAWLSDRNLWIALVAVAAAGAVLAWKNSRRAEPGSTEPPPEPIYRWPVSLEYWAVGVMAAAGLIWIGFQVQTGAAAWDQLSLITIAAVLAFGHLFYRRFVWTNGEPVNGRLHLTTERLMLTALVLAGISVGCYVYRSDANQLAGSVTTDWPTFRANMERTGATLAADAGPSNPRVLWTFDPGVKKGRVTLDSSPTVVDGQVYVGALYNVQSSFVGYLYCINATEGRIVAGKPLPLGERLWTFNANSTLQGVFSSPTVVAGRVYVGEGFHQDAKCRLFCINARDASQHWSLPTESHVESSPTIVGDRLYFGAGDDGVFCLELSQPKSTEVGQDQPKPLWHLEKLHVDSAPTVADGRVFLGSIEGDLYKEFAAFALDANKGDVLWRVAAPAPLPASPVVAGDAVYFALGNGKLNQLADHPLGAVWKLDAKTGHKQWEFQPEGSVFSSPIVRDDHVYVVCMDSYCYCLNAKDGAVVWKMFLHHPISAGPILAGGKVYVQSNAGVLYCLKADNGDLLWTFNQVKSKAEAAYASPALVDGKLYVAIDGKVHCIGD